MTCPAGAAGSAGAEPEPALWLQDRFCSKAMVAWQSLELWGVNKYNKIEQSGCVLLQGLSPISGAHRGTVFLQPVLEWETETVAVASKCDVGNLGVSGIRK